MQIPPSSPGQKPLSGNFQAPPDLRPARDNTYVKPPIHLPLEKVQLATAQTAANTAANTEVAFVEGHAPLTLKLNPTQFQQLETLLKRFPELKPDLEQLCAKPAGNPQILARDKKGQTVLDHLHRLATEKSTVAGVKPESVLRELLPRLADRQTIFQGPQFTCGSAALQNWLAKAEPGELTRIMTDLTLKGKCRLQDKTELKLPPDLDSYLAKRAEFKFNNGKDTDKRAVCDVLFQSAVMQDVSLVGGNRAWKGQPNGVIDAGIKGFAWLTDWAGYDAEGDDVGLMSRLSGDGGGDPLLLQSLMSGITGQPFQMQTLLSSNSALEKTLNQLAANKQECVALYKSPLHYVLLKDYDPKTRMVTCLSTGTYNSSEEKIPLDQFLANCGALILPK